MFLESVTVILWILFALSVGLAVWGLVRRSAKTLLLAAFPAGVFAFFFFWDPRGRLFFIWPLALLASVVSLRWPGRWREWFLLAAGIGALAGGVLMLSHPFGNEVAQPVPGESVRVGPSDPEEDARRVIVGYLRTVAAGDAGALQSYIWRYAEASAERPPLQKGEVQGRLAAVESQGGFGAGGLWVEAFFSFGCVQGSSKINLGKSHRLP